MPPACSVKALATKGICSLCSKIPLHKGQSNKPKRRNNAMMQHEQNPAAEGERAARRDKENQARADRMRETCREAMR
jgi:hypothetical protein